jgi:sugar lactone lactonase YvrE
MFWEDIQMRSGRFVAETVYRVLALFAMTGVISATGCGIGTRNATVTSTLVVSDTHQNRVLIYDAPFSTGQSASLVLGQTSFTTETSGTTANTLFYPGAIALDSAGSLFVADAGNCRVIRFDAPFSTGMSADLVFGQPNLTSGSCPTSVSATSLGESIPLGNGVFGIPVISVVSDSSGDLWVADSEFHRVLEYKPPSSNGMAAVLAIGQVDLNSGSPNQGGSTPTDATLLIPVGLAFDPSGNLWIVDHGNSRVLEFKPPFSTGMAASMVLGQVGFNHGSPNQGGATGANTLNYTLGATFDAAGSLWVADALNHRVLEFQAPFTTNMNASLVLGQVDFTHGLSNQGGTTLTSATLNNPHEVTFDSSGRLFVSDSQNDRALMFAPPFSNGMNASLVIGQADFASAVKATTAAGVNFPIGVIAASAH